MAYLNYIIMDETKDKCTVKFDYNHSTEIVEMLKEDLYILVEYDKVKIETYDYIRIFNIKGANVITVIK